MKRSLHKYVLNYFCFQSKVLSEWEYFCQQLPWEWSIYMTILAMGSHSIMFLGIVLSNICWARLQIHVHALGRFENWMSNHKEKMKQGYTLRFCQAIGSCRVFTSLTFLINFLEEREAVNGFRTSEQKYYTVLVASFLYWLLELRLI